MPATERKTYPAAITLAVVFSVPGISLADAPGRAVERENDTRATLNGLRSRFAEQHHLGEGMHRSGFNALILPIKSLLNGDLLFG
jgi:hypothetical protein